MNKPRRDFVKTSLVIASAGLCALAAPELYAAWSQGDFAETPFDQTIKRILKGKPIVGTDKIDLTIPEIAENGTVVPITVTSSLENIGKIMVLVEQNPVPLIMQAQLQPELVPFISARLKIANSSFVHVIAEGDKVCYSIKKKVKVTIGGCGG
jgi:sulfur-oxidizing protein SoxY